MKKTILITLSVLLICSCASLGRPSWIANTYDSHKKERSYLCAVGSGSTLQEAGDNAISNLSTVFSAEVTSQQSYSSQSQASSDGSYSDKSEFSDKSEIRSSSIITGIEISDSYYKDGVYWARASLDRNKTIKLYTGIVKDLQGKLDKAQDIALDKQSVFSRLIALHDTQALAQEIENYHVQLRVLAKKAYSSPVAELQALITKTASKISVALDLECSEAVKPRLQANLASYCQSYGFTVNQKSSTRLNCKLELKDLIMEGSPYFYTMLSLAISVKEDSLEVFSYEYNKRITAITQDEANRKALNEALLKADSCFEEISK